MTIYECAEITNSEDFINGDEIPRRIAQIESANCHGQLEGTEGCDSFGTCPHCYGEAEEELAKLQDFCNDLQDLLGISYLTDNNPTIVRATYFETYARESAYDIGDIEANGSVDSYVDWEAYADAVQQDYSPVDFDGITYLVRG